jgi:Mg-chelatase subunit ChlD
MGNEQWAMSNGQRRQPTVQKPHSHASVRMNNTAHMKAVPVLVVSTLLIAATLRVAAQQPEFKAGVELVTIPVTVTTRDHNTFIEGLTAADFQVEENGQKQAVTTVTRERRPLSIAMVVDSSGSMGMGNRRQLASAAARQIFDALKPDDELSIVFFGEKIELHMPWTRISNVTGFDWTGWRPFGMSPINDGMRLGLQLIDTASNPRRVVVLLTDGFENTSRMSLGDLVKTRQQSEVSVYGIGIGSADIMDLAADAQGLRPTLPSANAENLRRAEAMGPGATTARSPNALPNFDSLETLVGDSGGSVNRLLSQSEVIMAVKNIIDEWQYEYLVGYTPAKALDGKYRKLKVQVNRRGTYVRHRGGYLALPLVQ